jgi:hypothetical protein
MIEATLGPDRLAALLSEGAAMAQDDLLARLTLGDYGPGTPTGAGAVADLRP